MSTKELTMGWSIIGENLEYHSKELSVRVDAEKFSALLEGKETFITWSKGQRFTNGDIEWGYMKSPRCGLNMKQDGVVFAASDVEGVQYPFYDAPLPDWLKPEVRLRQWNEYEYKVLRYGCRQSDESMLERILPEFNEIREKVARALLEEIPAGEWKTNEFGTNGEIAVMTPNLDMVFQHTLGGLSVAGKIAKKIIRLSEMKGVQILDGYGGDQVLTWDSPLSEWKLARLYELYLLTQTETYQILRDQDWEDLKNVLTVLFDWSFPANVIEKHAHQKARRVLSKRLSESTPLSNTQPRVSDVADVFYDYDGGSVIVSIKKGMGDPVVPLLRMDDADLDGLVSGRLNEISWEVYVPESDTWAVARAKACLTEAGGQINFCSVYRYAINFAPTTGLKVFFRWEIPPRFPKRNPLASEVAKTDAMQFLNSQKQSTRCEAG